MNMIIKKTEILNINIVMIERKFTAFNTIYTLAARIKIAQFWYMKTYSYYLRYSNEI